MSTLARVCGAFVAALSLTFVFSASQNVFAQTCTQPPAGMTAWYPADGNYNDIIGGNHGTPQGDPEFVAGKVAQAFSFDGGTDSTVDYVRVNAAPALDVGASGTGLTIDAWINPSSAGPLVEWNNGTAIGTHFWLFPNSDNLYVNLVDTSGNTHNLQSVAGVITPGVYQHVAVTYDKATGTTTLYRNGMVVASQNLGTFTPQTSYDLYFAFRPSDTNRYAGTLDEVEIFNRALSQTEIQNIVNADSAGKCKSSAPGQVIISELRARGINDANDEFIEFYNTSGQDILVASIDGSMGWALVGANGVTRFVIPNGTPIPSRGHFLAVNSNGYSLNGYPAGNATTATGDIAYTQEIGDTEGVALFRTSNPANFVMSERLDAFGYTSSPPLYREGSGYPYALFNNNEQTFYRDLSRGLPKDTDNNAGDFIVVNATPNRFDYGLSLGAPGPENRTSPIQRNSELPITLFDPTASNLNSPNRERDSTVVPNGQFGTLIVRKTFTNGTGQMVTRLRIRVIDITTLHTPVTPQPGQSAPCHVTSPCADIRALSSPNEAAVATNSGPMPTSGLLLEEPPMQPLAGAHNSSLAVRTVSLATPLMPGDKVNVNFRLGIEARGTFRFYINLEAVTAPVPVVTAPELTTVTPTRRPALLPTP